MIRLPSRIFNRAVDWTNEETSRFSEVVAGSGVWTGELDLEYVYGLKDDGAVFEEELERIGYKGDVPAEPREEYAAYVEQGPHLKSLGMDVGVVTGIAGVRRGEITFYGEADHPGPTPMHLRNDALAGAVDVVGEIRKLAGTLGEDTVTTVARMDVDPNLIRFIPKRVDLTWDVRGPDPGVVQEGVENILRTAERVADREGLTWEWDEILDLPPVEYELLSPGTANRKSCQTSGPTPRGCPW